VDKNLNIKL